MADKKITIKPTDKEIEVRLYDGSKKVEWDALTSKERMEILCSLAMVTNYLKSLNK